MKQSFISILVAAMAVFGQAQEKGMDELWGNTRSAVMSPDDPRAALFRDGNYGMFIHWGIYSHLAGKWQDETYYGIGEWIMHPRRAGIPPVEYMKLAREFNPMDFDAKGIVDLAKTAGMKWIIITSKHHDGFAMFDSAHPFNIVDATPFKRDPMRELADACRAAGLGFGFYYSHNQDWTTPGATGGPTVDANGLAASFERYYREKCFPQVKEICENYGGLDYVWFDTPSGMPEELVREMAAYVRTAQPKAMLCSRVGYGLGDYVSLGDMAVPTMNTPGLWETCDTTNDSWSYAWYDQNWKDARTILRRLVATVARGGTYLLNIGPDGRGRVPAPASRYLRASGEWIRDHADVIYAAEPSPWGKAFPWGDVTRQGETLNVVVFDRPSDGRLHLPGFRSSIKSVVLETSEGAWPLKWDQSGDWLELTLPDRPSDSLAQVVRLETAGNLEVEQTHAVFPNTSTRLMAEFAEVSDAKVAEKRWMEKFGEWVHVYQVSHWRKQGMAVWEVDVKEPGFYHVGLNYSGTGRLAWRLTTDENNFVQNQQNSSHIYQEFPLGMIEFKTSGRHSLTVSLIDGDPERSSLQWVSLSPAR